MVVVLPWERKREETETGGLKTECLFLCYLCKIKLVGNLGEHEVRVDGRDRLSHFRGSTSQLYAFLPKLFYFLFLFF